MRSARVLLLLALAAGCGDEDPPPESTPPPRGPALFSGTWQPVRFENVALAVPEEFTRDVRDFQRGQRLFYGPPTNGAVPSVQVIRQPFARDTQAWFERWRDKYRRGPRGLTKVIEARPATIAGKACHELVYQIPEGERLYMTIAWLWAEDGHGYIVRGLAEKASFVAVYREVFDRVRSTVRLMP